MTFFDKFQSIFSIKSHIKSLKINALIIFFLCIYNVAFGLIVKHATSFVLGLSFSVVLIYIITIYFAEKNKNINPEYAFNYGYTKNESIFVLIHLFLSFMTIIFVLIYYFNIFNNRSYTQIDKQIIILMNILISTIVLFFTKRKFDNNLIKIRDIELYFNFIVWKNAFIILFVSFVASLFIIIFYQANNITFTNYFDFSVSVLIALYLLILPLKNISVALKQLLDNTASDEIQFNIIAVIVDNLHNFCEFKSLHVRYAGKKLFIEIDVVLPWDYTIEQKFILEKNFEKQIKEIYPNSIFRLYVVPCKRECLTDQKIQCPLRKS